jgi:hypothetical protein
MRKSNPLRSFVVRQVKEALHRSGRMIANQDIYGLDAFVDVKRLSQRWPPGTTRQFGSCCEVRLTFV